MSTDKKAVKLLADICKRKGINKVVFSPGSRSAPLVIAFSSLPDIECIVIPDERVAGYFALGMAQQLKQTIAIVCTSGTAVLNLGPAITEAFYQQIPLLILTADRPLGDAEKGENQSINQAFVFEKLTKNSFDINGDETSRDGLNKIAEIITGAIHNTQNNGVGPVHVNIRLSEPLYNQSDELAIEFNIKNEKQQAVPNDAGIKRLNEQLTSTKKKLIIVGMRAPDVEFSKKLRLLSERKDTVVLAETLSNTVFNGSISNYDACLELINEKEANEFTPDIVITLGNQIISKRIRRFLKKDKPVSHWDISPHNVARHYDVFDIGVQKENITESEALDCLLNSNPMDDSFYNSQWKGLHKKAIELTGKYLAQTEYSDIKVFETLVDSFPKGANIQYGNSTPVRYSNFFEHSNDIITNSNRGTSGIDGCVSTAAGAAYVNEKLTICIVGDISFFYDSNALFNNYLSPNFRIIVINNSGGNIFRLIDVPAKVNAFEKFFEMRHNLTAKYLAAMYDIPYYFCETEGSLNEILPDFYKPHNGKPAILEIKTNGELSAKIYKEYFSFLKNKIL